MLYIYLFQIPKLFKVFMNQAVAPANTYLHFTLNKNVFTILLMRYKLFMILRLFGCVQVTLTTPI